MDIEAKLEMQGVIDKLQELIQWVPITEKLPEPYQIVFVYFETEEKESIAQFFSYDDGRTRWYPELDMVEVERERPSAMYGKWEEVNPTRQFYAEVTHWMTIPKFKK